jgi:hypothetical protein
VPGDEDLEARMLPEPVAGVRARGRGNSQALQVGFELVGDPEVRGRRPFEPDNYTARNSTRRAGVAREADFRNQDF